MKTIDESEAKKLFLRLLEEVAQGEEYVITRQGVAVGCLTPLDESERQRRTDIVESFEEYRRREMLMLGGLSIKEMIEDGRRF